ncbi:hypothetical protein ACFQ3W_11415 [Paenibacillus puldeungensis]|uniref:Uncharacterized protein n=1 Tax=Paenibacillus puldeungensis TaxID=696536 RepID=A0ABW3RWY1_9BACL
MSDKKIFEWNIEIDDRDIDKTDKKLRSLDKLLQQTQRRAATLGKTRIKPVISLDDRFTSTERKITDRLKQLGRTTVKPTVILNDRVSAGATRIRASLASLTATPWRISVAGVNWQQVVGGSFNNWMSSSGKSTMKSISAAISSSISGGVQNAIQQALSMVGVITKGTTGNGKGNPTPGIPTKPKSPAIGPSGFPKFHPTDLINSHISEVAQKPSPAQPSKKSEGFLQKTGAFAKDVGKDVAKDYAKDGVKSLIDKLMGKKDDGAKNGNCTCVCNCNCGGGGGDSGGMMGGDVSGGTGRGKKGKNQTRNSSRRRFGGGKMRFGGVGGAAGKAALGRGAAGKIGLGLLMNTGVNFLSDEGPDLLSGAKDLAGKGVSSVKKGASWLGEKGSNLLSKGAGWLGKGIGKLAKFSPVSLLKTGANFVSEKGPGLLEGAKDLAGKGVSSVKEGASWLGEKGSNLLGKGTGWLGKGLGKVGGWLGKGAKFLGKAAKSVKLPGPAKWVSDIVSVATAGSGRDRVKAITSGIFSAIGGTLGGSAGSFILPGAGTAGGAMLGSAAGDYVGGKVGNFVSDLFFGKEKKSPKVAKAANQTPSKISAKSAPALGLRMPALARVPAFPMMGSFPVPAIGGNRTAKEDGKARKESAPAPINVSVSQGAVNLTVNKDEINYDELAKKAGLKIANEVRFAMQNLK